MTQPLLHLENLSAGYPQRRQIPREIVKPFTETLSSGKLVCLIGPNGAGKSTLLRTIAGMQKPLSGRVLLNGESIHEMVASERARRLSVVLTQRMDAGLFTGYGLVAMGRHPYTTWTGQLSEYDHRIICRSLEMVGAEDLAEQLFNTMSDGQRQKIMIARALAQEPELLVLDEPTAFLDLPRRVECMNLLRSLAHKSGCTILLSIHDLDLALRSADYIWLLPYNGQMNTGLPEDLVLNGTFEDAFRSAGVQFDMETGAFRAYSDRKKSIALKGEGIPYIWTRRALEREGYNVANTHHPGLPLVQLVKEETNCWHLIKGDHKTTCHSVNDLLDALDY